jgi:hypothetical protein
MPDITVISWVRNECDIIEAFVRHHSRIAKRLIVIDNGSTDNTLRLLEELHGEGLPLEIRSDPAPVHRQSRALSGLLGEAARDAAWVLPLDADEFLLPAGAIADVLAAAPQDEVLLLPWRTYVPTPADDATESNPLRRITHRRDREGRTFPKSLIPAAIARLPQASLALGNHHVLRPDGDPFPERLSDALYLAHFPVRSSDQLRGKILAGWKRHRANPDAKPGEMFHWQALWERCAAGSDLSADELRAIAIAYANDLPTELIADPVPSADTLRYTPLPVRPGSAQE